MLWCMVPEEFGASKGEMKFIRKWYVTRKSQNSRRYVIFRERTYACRIFVEDGTFGVFIC